MGTLAPAHTSLPHTLVMLFEQAFGIGLKHNVAQGYPDTTRTLCSPNHKIGDSFASGHSEKSAVMHLKMVIIDGVDVITRSAAIAAMSMS